MRQYLHNASSTLARRCGLRSETECKSRRMALDVDEARRSGCRRVPVECLFRLASLFVIESKLSAANAGHFAVAIFLQKFRRLSSAPNKVLKIVESANNTSPARSPSGGIQRNILNSLFPASVKGCGFDVSIGCFAST